MEYKVATTPEDIRLANECVAASGYYMPVDLANIGGAVVTAINGDEAAGVAWVCISKERAYLDYLAVRPGYHTVAFRLLTRLRALLRSSGVKHVIYHVHGDNAKAIRLAGALGGDTDFPYLLGCVDLEADNGV